MKVRLIKQDGRSGLRMVGEVMDVIKPTAQKWIKLGIAEPLKVKKPMSEETKQKIRDAAKKRKKNGNTSK